MDALTEQVIVALARQRLFEGIRPGPGNEDSLAEYKAAMKVAYDEHGLVRGAGHVCDGKDCKACDDVSLFDGFMSNRTRSV